MKKKFLIIIIGFLVAFPIFVKSEDGYIPKKGDLSCPKQKNGNGCQMYIDDEPVETMSNKVNKVIVTEKFNGTIDIEKIVTKIKKGSYKLEFRIKGPKDKVSISKNAYIAILFDSSVSMKNNVEGAKKALQESFIDGLTKKELDVQYYIVNFAGHTNENNIHWKDLISDSIEATDLFKNNVNLLGKDSNQICENSNCKVGQSSRIELALKYATVAFKKLDDKNALKYVLVIGDGRYYKGADTCWDSQLVDGGKVCATNTRAYEGSPEEGIEPAGSHASKGKRVLGKDVLQNELEPLIGGKNQTYFLRYLDNKSEYNNRNATFVSSYFGHVYAVDNNGEGEFKRVLKIIANDLAGKIETEQISGTLIDKVGEKFTIKKSDTTKLEWKIKDWTKWVEIPAENESITLKIDKTVDDGWYRTNQYFKVKVGKDKNGKDIEYTSTVNPVVYWEKEPEPGNSCSFEASINDEGTTEKSYYSYNCNQGTDEDVDGMNIKTYVKNLKFGTQSFEIQRGEGFTSSIELSNEVKCTYEFNYKKFNDKYQEIKGNYDNATSSQDKNKYKDSLDKLVKNVTNYNSLLDTSDKGKNNLISYVKEFDKQKATISINYIDSKGKTDGSSDSLEYVNSGDTVSKIKCKDTGDTVSLANGNKVNSKTECTLKVNKKMELSEMCINMYGGTPEKCKASSKKQLKGGKYFYPNMEKSGGYINIVIPDVDYFDRDVKLIGSEIYKKKYKCQFKMFDSNNDSTISFRQIELNDPFIQTYTNGQRKIGKNWINKKQKYDFTNIIDNNIWENSKNFEYQYNISKINANDIVKDNSQQGVSSYLGRDCDFNSNNQWICSFVRPTKGKNGNNDFFTNIKIK